MLPLQTIVDIENPSFNIDYHSKVFLMGSCFTDNIGNQLERMKFNVIKNPFGVLYNPLSISNSIQLLLSDKQFDETDLHFYNEKWFSFLHHTSFSSPDKNQCLNNINNVAGSSSQFLKQSDVLFITLGTSYVYKYKKTGNIVANCHKMPSAEFKRIFLKPDETYSALKNALAALWDIRPEMKVVLTVSPVRHWKDGAIGNQQSKASLIIGIKMLLDEFEHVFYFPSYEIFMDEMRDYRYYDKDLIHPSEAGKEYIWERFKSTFMTAETREILKKVLAIVDAYEHKPFWPETQEFRKFAKKNLGKIEEITKDVPSVRFQQEADHFLQYIK